MHIIVYLLMYNGHTIFCTVSLNIPTYMYADKETHRGRFALENTHIKIWTFFSAYVSTPVWSLF